MRRYERGYQQGYSTLQTEVTFDLEKRQRKAEKILAVLMEFFGDTTTRMRVLDVGCSIGIVSSLAGESFQLSFGLDIDKEAVKYAQINYSNPSTSFLFADSMDIPVRDECVDAVICSHVYEHVPDADRMMHEIYRVLAPGGICYFAAGNLLQVMEPHYRIPFLSLLPRPFAGLILRITGKGNMYYEKHKTLIGLRKLVMGFEVKDYTFEVVRDPLRFKSTDMIKPGSLFQSAALILMRFFYLGCPTYIWLLIKPEIEKDYRPLPPE